MSLEIEKLKTKLTELENYLTRTNLSFLEVVDWTSACVALFSEIGVNDIIIGKFLDIYKNQTIHRKESGIFDDSHFGPFSFNSTLDSFSPKGKHYSFRPTFSSLYVYVPFVAAKKILEKRENDERIISKTLINIFDRKNTQNIKIGFENIQKNYEEQDSRGMISNLVTITQSILNLIPETASEKSIGRQISTLYNDKELRKKYSINREVLWSLNNARIIRNEEVQHQKNEHEGNISLVEVIGYTHILVLFINSLLASGEINL